MSDPTKVYVTVKLFLENRMYNSKKRVKGIEDGHMILFYIEAVLKSPCCSAPEGSCVDISFEKLFYLMESGTYFRGEALQPGDSGWTHNDTNAALIEGGYPPNQHSAFHVDTTKADSR